MSAYVIVEFTVKDPDVYRDKYSAVAGKTAKEHGGEALANSNWDVRSVAMDARFSLLEGLPTPTEDVRASE
jgi:hypothetical protein